jgi:hypothetical protein
MERELPADCGRGRQRAFKKGHFCGCFASLLNRLFNVRFASGRGSAVCHKRLPGNGLWIGFLCGLNPIRCCCYDDEFL